MSKVKQAAIVLLSFMWVACGVLEPAPQAPNADPPTATAVPMVQATPTATSMLTPTPTATPVPTPTPTPVPRATPTTTPTPAPRAGWRESRDEGRVYTNYGTQYGGAPVAPLYIECPTRETLLMIWIARSGDLPAADYLEVAWDGGEPVAVPYRPKKVRPRFPTLGRRSVIPTPTPLPTLGDQYLMLYLPDYFLERTFVSSRLRIRFPDGQTHNYDDVSGLPQAYQWVCGG